MSKIGFLQVTLKLGVIAFRFFADEALRLIRRDAKVNNQIFYRQCVDLIFELLEPCEKLLARFAGCPRALMRQVRGR